MNVKQRMLRFLCKNSGRNTFSAAQARNMWRFENVHARIHELRNDGWPIHTTIKKRADGSPVAVYKLGQNHEINLRKSA